MIAVLWYATPLVSRVLGGCEAFSNAQWSGRLVRAKTAVESGPGIRDDGFRIMGAAFISYVFQRSSKATLFPRCLSR